eukprot:3941741-Rhodomonas_salina.3
MVHVCLCLVSVSTHDARSRECPVLMWGMMVGTMKGRVQLAVLLAMPCVALAFLPPSLLSPSCARSLSASSFKPQWGQPLALSLRDFHNPIPHREFALPFSLWIQKHRSRTALSSGKFDDMRGRGDLEGGMDQERNLKIAGVL